MLSLVAMSALTQRGLPQPPGELGAYLRAPDSSFDWHVASRSETENCSSVDLAMTSQTWHGVAWKHTVVVVRPKGVPEGPTAILYITGDDPNPADRAELIKLSEIARLPAAMLYNIPVQPIFGLEEDNLVAETFKRYLNSGDATWPLLFPMAKGAIRAMDAVQQFLKEKVQKFVITGASKRGWTTWMAAASGDKRIAGIAPMVIDNLNTAKQLAHQKELWGHFSAMFEPYVSRGLMERIGTTAGLRLAATVDPFSYRANFKMPTLVINAGNDPYWAIDALSQYWDGLPQRKWTTMVPNVDHDMGDKVECLDAIGAFAASVAGKFQMPVLKATGASRPFRGRSAVRSYHVVSLGAGLSNLSVWQAESDSFDFKDSTWKMVSGHANYRPDDATGSTTDVSFTTSSARNIAEFVEGEYVVGGHTFKICSPTRIFRAAKG